MLCLFPFEPDFYRQHGVRAIYVGHPMADQIDASDNPGTAREQLDLDPQKTTIALLPGSRRSEVSRLAGPMIDAARRLQQQQPDLQLVVAVANDAVGELFREDMSRLGFDAIKAVSNRPRTVIAAADVVLCASGTAALEILLVNRPMVVTYQLAPASYLMLKYLRMMKTPAISLPNILAGEKLVPELIQKDSTGPNLASEARKWLDDEPSVIALRSRFLDIHQRLRCDASQQAANAVASMLEP